MKKGLLIGLLVEFLLVGFQQAGFSQVHPKDYVKVLEVIDPGRADGEIPLTSVMDARSNVAIKFDNAALVKGLLAGQTSSVRIRVEAKIQHKDGKPVPIEIDNFMSLQQGQDEVTFRYHDKRVDVDKTLKESRGRLPDSFINLTQVGVSPGDRLYLKITDVTTQMDLNFVVTLGEYGLNPKLTDSFFLLKRLGVSKEDETSGIPAVNFRPAPGVVFGWVYSARKNPVMRVLNPGFGYNVSFADWNEPAFDVASGQFLKGTEANKIEITAGPVFSLFDNSLQFTYGWNLNVRTDRAYFGIGFSFFKLSEKIAGLIKQ